MAQNVVSFNYTPRPLFLPYHKRAQRWACMVVHRRAGKTVATVADLVLKALYTKKKNARFGYVAPFRQQAKEIAWQYLKDFTTDLREGRPRESELRVKLPNGAWITLYGADNPDSLRGLYFDGLVLDEFGDMRPSLLGEVILPTLADRNGWLTAIGTSKGRNQFYNLARKAEVDPEWYYLLAKASQTGLLNDAELKQIKDVVSPEEYEQEFECSFDAAVKGTYYAHLINKAEDEGRCPVDTELYDPDQKVSVVADLGYSDTCAWWFWQRRPDGFALIDYYESSGRDLLHYLKILMLRGYDLQDIWLPHDAKAKTLQTGKSTIEQLLEPWRLFEANDEKIPEYFPKGKRLPLRIVPKLAVQHGIDAVRAVLPRCHFDKTKCFNGLEALRSYRREWHETSQTFSKTPKHDWASNGADSFRYFAVVCEKSKGQSAEQHLNRKPREDRNWRNQVVEPERFTLEDLYKDRKRLNAGFNRGRI